MHPAFVERPSRPCARALLVLLSAWAQRLPSLLAAALFACLLVACGGGDDATPQIPTLLSQPSDQSVVEGSGATFSVSANGAAPLAYQWASGPDGTTFAPIAGATHASYSTGATALAENGMRYRVTVSNAVGSFGQRRPGVEVERRPAKHHAHVTLPSLEPRCNPSRVTTGRGYATLAPRS